jgi:hypothetical protein
MECRRRRACSDFFAVKAYFVTGVFAWKLLHHLPVKQPIGNQNEKRCLRSDSGLLALLGH